MRFVIGSDHAGVTLKQAVSEHLLTAGYEVADVETSTGEPVDYPEIASQVARQVVSGGVQCGILVCGSGVGMSIAANKIAGVRAALCTDGYMATVSRAHNDANVLCLGERVIGEGLALAIVDAFINTEFEGGRHARRVVKIGELEQS